MVLREPLELGFFDLEALCLRALSRRLLAHASLLGGEGGADLLHLGGCHFRVDGRGEGIWRRVAVGGIAATPGGWCRHVDALGGLRPLRDRILRAVLRLVVEGAQDRLRLAGWDGARRLLDGVGVVVELVGVVDGERVVGAWVEAVAGAEFLVGLDAILRRCGCASGETADALRRGVVDLRRRARCLDQADEGVDATKWHDDAASRAGRVRGAVARVLDEE